MSRQLEPILPAAFAQAASAELDPNDGFTILLLSNTGEGWPHAAMISTGEIVTIDDTKLLLALWPRSTATRNLSAFKRATLLAVIEHTSYSVRFSVRRLPDFDTPLGGTMACFEGAVNAASADEAPYAVLEAGIRFRLNDPAATLARWRETRAALQAIALAP